MKVLLLTPPLTQLNTPYPATAYLTGFLRGQNIEAVQDDFSIKLITRLFSAEGLRRVRWELQENEKSDSLSAPLSVDFFLKNFARFEATTDFVLKFLQGKDPSLALRINTRKFLPEGPVFKKSITPLEENNYLDFAFGTIGVQDRAKYFASLFINELAEIVRAGIDPRFELSKYAEKLAASEPTFAPLEAALTSKPTLLDMLLAEITHETLAKQDPAVVALSVPFPGNLYGALKIAQVVKQSYPHIKIILGGGYANTELRSLEEAKIFDYVDFISLDDGERPFLQILKHLKGEAAESELLRTYKKSDGALKYFTNEKTHDIPFKDCGNPTYDGLPLDQYLSILEMLNPAHRLWSDARWNKVTLAHGCYWKKCSFCDVTLDYIGRYEPAGVDLILERMLSLQRETGTSGFHFVDEAAPPALLKALSERILERGLSFSWWGNLRFDKAFTPELARLMAEAGCVAVTGGLEVASDRLLKLMQKGVTIDQVARVTKAFNEAGILVHAYLMYGFPTETEQETVDSVEVVRQLFANGCIDSAYWHRFSATIHSPIGKNPEAFGIKIHARENESTPLFAQNDLRFTDPTHVDHSALGEGLKKSLYNYMHGIGLDEDVRAWFPIKVPKTTVPKNRIAVAL